MLNEIFVAAEHVLAGEVVALVRHDPQVFQGHAGAGSGSQRAAHRDAQVAVRGQGFELGLLVFQQAAQQCVGPHVRAARAGILIDAKNRPELVIAETGSEHDWEHAVRVHQ